MGVADKEEFGVVLEKAYTGIIKTLYLDEQGYLVIDHVCELPALHQEPMSIILSLSA